MVLETPSLQRSEGKGKPWNSQVIMGVALEGQVAGVTSVFVQTIIILEL